jgi:pimeloyl-ACP methyl ester carboxylesterase
MKKKHMLVGILIIVVAGFVVLNVLAYGRAHDMMYFTAQGSSTSRPESLTIAGRLRAVFAGINVRRPASDLDPVALAANCRRIPIPCPGDITLGTWYCDRGSDTQLAVLFHGYTGEKATLLNEAQIFLDLGMSVLLVDFRGSGESSETYTTIGFDEAVDVATVVQFAENTFSHSSIILFGQSMGAVAIMRAIKEYDINPDAVIAEAVFDTMLNTVRNRFKKMQLPSFPSAELLVFWGGKHTGFNAFSHNPVDYARSVRCPILFMHGSNDERATIDEGRRVYCAVPGMKEFKEFSSAGHEAYASSFPDEWKNTVAKFVKTTVTGMKGRRET